MHGSQFNVIQKGYIMFQLSATYQHTTEGRREIVRKCYGLTQSERLALILVDGTHLAIEVRDRIRALDDEDFRQIMNKLLSLGLISEVCLAPADFAHGHECNACEPPVGLHDRLAPVTMVCNDPHYDFSVAATAATDYHLLCPTASTALALEEWTKLRGWHVGRAALPAQAAAAARQHSHIAGKAFTASRSRPLTPKRFPSDVDGTPSSARSSHTASGSASGKRPVAISLLLSIGAFLKGTMAVVR